MSRLWILVGALGLTVAGVGCGPPKRCEGVVCAAGMACAEADGECHCGGPSGPLCVGESVCEPVSASCVPTGHSCELVTCGGGTSCDVTDGTCKCGGAGGEVCEADTRCENVLGLCRPADPCDTVQCGIGETCDEVTGQCTCGAVGVCAAGERCEAGTCVEDQCLGVACVGGTRCDPADGTCRCGGAGGLLCTAGEVCDPDQKTCVPAAGCLDVTCPGTTSCDPVDGVCKCGGAGGTVCTPDQVCDLNDFTCTGGDPCVNVTCSGGTTCDPEDGICRCGGLGGEVCPEGELCVLLSDEGALCSPPCAPVFPDCPETEACYYSTEVRTSFCYAEGNAGPGGYCARSTDCAAGNHCQIDGTGPGVCLSYCDTGASYPQPGSCPLQHYCDPVFGPGSQVGICRPTG